MQYHYGELNMPTLIYELQSGTKNKQLIRGILYEVLKK